MSTAFEGHGPVYDVDGAGLHKFRRASRRGLKHLAPEDRRAYGEAVERAILAKQRSRLRSFTPPDLRPSCASGTWHTTGADIDAAIKAQQGAALLNCPGQIRRSRSPDEWRRLYDEAMHNRAARRSRAAKKAWATRRLKKNGRKK